MGDFLRQTSVSGDGGHFTAELSEDWAIWGPNGGYVAAIALRAAARATELPRPASFAGHFLSVARFAPVDIEVKSLRRARRAESLSVSIVQNGSEVFSAIVWAVAEGDGLEHDALSMPEVPRPAELKTVEELADPASLDARHRFWSNLDAKPVAFVPWGERQPGAPRWREWYRFRPVAAGGDAFAAAARSLLLIDTMLWPAAHSAHPRDIGVVAPSLDVTAQFHRIDGDAEWLLVDAQAPIAADGLIGGQARIWSESGKLLASGTGHLLCRPRPG